MNINESFKIVKIGKFYNKEAKLLKNYKILGFQIDVFQIIFDI